MIPVKAEGAVCLNWIEDTLTDPMRGPLFPNGLKRKGLGKSIRVSWTQPQEKILSFSTAYKIDKKLRPDLLLLPAYLTRSLDYRTGRSSPTGSGDGRVEHSAVRGWTVPDLLC